jgi:hypothetical protein
VRDHHHRKRVSIDSIHRQGGAVERNRALFGDELGEDRGGAEREMRGAVAVLARQDLGDAVDMP